MYGTVIGRVGKVESKDINGTFLLSISVVENKYMKGEDVSTWYQVSFWGKRAAGIAKHIFVGQSISVVGQSYNQDYQDKKYLKLDADHIVIQQWKDSEEKPAQNNDFKPTGGFKSAGNAGAKSNPDVWDDDDIPL